MKRLLLPVLFTAFFWASCEVAPEPIRFGEDSCHFCKMTIVDRQHAAQYVTVKGKQYKFDAVECMLNELSERGLNHVAIFLVSDYNDPGSMTDAVSATYLICKEIKSPMGAFLTSFKENETASETQKELGGDLHSWSGMLDKYQVQQ